PYFDSPFCLINYWQNGGFFLKSEIPDGVAVTGKPLSVSQENFVNSSNYSPGLHICCSDRKKT
ncbi:hypothetical protein WMO21_07570, partial [Lachnospiraceae bacterium CLA-AA-H58]|uniref:hypothetical protein n=1 Tax=Pilosibacter fragilis TaxID=3078042 RepID=UPI0032D39ED9